MTTGFIYEWVNLKTGMKYLGRHEGQPNDGYIGSGVIFRKFYDKHPEDFKRYILWEGTNISPVDLKNKEAEFLSKISDEELFYGKNKRYYNQVRNSSGYTSEDNPMRHLEVIERMKLTQIERGIHKNPWQRTVEKYGYEKACEMSSKHSKGNKNGSGNLGKPKSEEHKRKIALNRKGGKPKGWKKDKSNLL